MKIEVGEERGFYSRRFYREITSDVYDIAKRLREIDPDYFILYDVRKDRFEIHHKGQQDNTFCLIVPYDTLDERTLILVYETRAEKAKEIFAKMQKHNERLDRQKQEDMRDYIKWVGTETFNYLNKYESKDSIDKDSKFFR